MCADRQADHGQAAGPSCAGQLPDRGSGVVRVDSLLRKAEKVVCSCSRLPEHISVSPSPTAVPGKGRGTPVGGGARRWGSSSPRGPRPDW